MKGSCSSAALRNDADDAALRVVWIVSHAQNLARANLEHIRKGKIGGGCAALAILNVEDSVDTGDGLDGGLKVSAVERRAEGKAVGVEEAAFAVGILHVGEGGEDASFDAAKE